MSTVLCIDDNAESLKIRALMLETRGHSVLTADNGPIGLKLLSENPVDITVLDYRMPEMDGLGVAKVIRECHGNMPILPLRGYPKELPKELQDIVDASVTKGQNPEVLLGEMQRLTGGAKKPPAPEIIAKSVDYLKKKQSSK